jgi:hypothetical protein
VSSGAADRLGNDPPDAYTGTPTPYRVESRDHRLLKGVEPINGEVGQTGRNGAASGWEMDTSFDFGYGSGPAPPNIELLARGTNNRVASCMTCYHHSGGGLVFAVGSICFTGSLVEDENLQIILRNVLDECLAA